MSDPKKPEDSRFDTSDEGDLVIPEELRPLVELDPENIVPDNVDKEDES